MSTIEELREHLQRARAAIGLLRDYAGRTLDYWDTDQDAKVGKRLSALSGMLNSYDAAVTEALQYAADQPLPELPKG